MDRIAKEYLQEIALEELFNQNTLPYAYTAEERKMTCAIPILMEMHAVRKMPKHT